MTGREPTAVEDGWDVGDVLVGSNVPEVLDELDREFVALEPVKTRIARSPRCS